MTDISHKQNKINRILFFPGFMISVLGTAFFSFATGLYLLETTGKGLFYSLNILLFTLPMIIFGPFLGDMADRFCKKKLIVLGDFLNAILMIGIYFFWDSGDKVLLIYLGTFFSSLFTSMVSISFSSGVPKFFGKEWMIQANSLSQIIDSLARIMGPFLGGLIYGLGNMKFFILFNGLSFFISLAFEMFLKVDSVADEDTEKKYRIRDGFEYLKKNRELKIFVIKFALINFAAIAAIIIPVPYVVNQIFKLGSKTLGMIQGTLPVGAIVGAVIVNRKKFVLSEKVFMEIFGVFFMTCIMLYSTSLGSMKSSVIPVVLSLAMFISGIAFGVLDVTAATYFQKNIPENIRGKVVGVITGMVKFAMPAAFILSGKIIDLYSPFMSIIIGGGIILGALIIFPVVTHVLEKSKIRISKIA